VAGLQRCQNLGEALARREHPELLTPFEAWDGALWDRIGTGACLFWAGATEGSGRVAMVLRKHAGEGRRAVQLWGTVGLEEAREGEPGEPLSLAEGGVWTRIPEVLETGTEALRFCGIGILPELGSVRTDLRPRGRCRLLLRRRPDRELLYRSAWLSMEAERLSVARLLASLRGGAHAREIEATWIVHSLCLTPTAEVPDNLPLLACTAGKWGRVALGEEVIGPGDEGPDAYLHGGGKAAF